MDHMNGLLSKATYFYLCPLLPLLSFMPLSPSVFFSSSFVFAISLFLCSLSPLPSLSQSLLHIHLPTVCTYYVCCDALFIDIVRCVYVYVHHVYVGVIKHKCMYITCMYTYVHATCMLHVHVHVYVYVVCDAIIIICTYMYVPVA